LKKISLQPYIWLGWISASNAQKYFDSCEDMHQTSIRKLGWHTFFSIMLVLAICCCIRTFVMDINGIQLLCLRDWFAPSGAILVLCGASLEWFESGIARETVSSIVVEDKIELMNWILDISKTIGFIAIFSGTAVWAYGDKLVALVS